MTFLIGLVLGLLLGWLIEWVLDWWFWRQGNDPLEAVQTMLLTFRNQATVPHDVHEFNAEIKDWQDKFKAAEAEIVQLKQSLREAEDCHPQLAEANREIARLNAELVAANRKSQASVQKGEVAQRKDRLEQINGIGKVFAGRLNDAGIYTFAALATLTPARIQEIIAPEEWQKVEFEEWIEQATDLAQATQATEEANE